MSNRNDPEASIGMAAFAGLAIVGLLLFFLAGLLSVTMTIVCIFAWNKERTFFGQVVTPTEARCFITAGIIGAIVFGMFGESLYHADMLLERNRGGMFFVGYVIASLGWGVWHANHQEEQEKQPQEALSSERSSTAAPQSFEPSREPEREFEFAHWDDEASRT